MIAPDQIVTTRTLARLLGLTSRRVQQLADQGVIPREARDAFRLGPAVQAWLRWRESRPARPDTAHAWLARESAQAKARENRVAREKLLPAPLAEETIAVFEAAIQTVLDSTPPELYDRIAATADQAVIRDLLRDESRRIRTAVADALERRAEELERAQ